MYRTKNTERHAEWLVADKRRRMLLSDLIVAFPAKILKYDPATREAEIEDQTARLFPNDDLSPGVQPLVEIIPPTPGVRVLFPGNGTTSITWRPKPGDHVLAMSCDQYLGPFMMGRMRVPPEFPFMHTHSTLVCVPLYFATFKEAQAAPTTDDLVIKHGGSKIELTEGGEVKVNGGTEAVAIASYVKDALSVLKAAIDGAAVVALDGGAAFKANLIGALASWPPDVAAANLKTDG